VSGLNAAELASLYMRLQLRAESFGNGAKVSGLSRFERGRLKASESTLRWVIREIDSYVAASQGSKNDE
jgi:hypothetical protein